MVGLLANIFDELDESSKELGVDANTAETAVLLGLEALKALCESEVSDKVLYRTVFDRFKKFN